MASSVLHEAAIKASNFAPSQDATSSKAVAAPNFQDELRKRLSTVKASTSVSGLLTQQPLPANAVSKPESPYVQKSVVELRAQLLKSKAVVGGAGLAVKPNTCRWYRSVFVFLFSTC
jgi:hypothetical protein